MIEDIDALHLAPRSPIAVAQIIHEHLSGIRMPPKQKREPMSLFHLPDELLLQVIGHLDQGDLYTLSISCKRLQRISLPAYLLRVGITAPLIFPIDHLHIKLKQFYLPGIPLAFIAKHVSKFSCDFSRIRYVPNPTSALQRLRRMIINIEGLENFAIGFATLENVFSFQPDFPEEACVDLLELVAERCTSLTLSSCDGRQAPTQFGSLQEAVTKWRSRPGPFQALKKHLSLGILRRRSCHSSFALKTFIVRSNGFLLPPFSSWAFKFVNTVPLKRLDLVEVNLANHFSRLIFGTLAIPSLEHLRIISCQFDFGPIARFLSRHNTISTFEFISQDMIQSSLPRSTLPRLFSLKSHPISIGRLLTRTGAFPKLSCICLAINLFRYDQFAFDDVEDSLAQAAARLTKMNIQLCVTVHRASRTDDWLNLETLPTNLNDYPVLSHVRGIAFDFPLPDVVATTAVPTWLSLFPLLEHIEFLDAKVGLDDQMSLLRSIVQKCSRIRSVRIGEDTRDVSAWLH